MALYDAQGHIFDTNNDGVPDRPPSNLLRAKATTDYDEQGRPFRTRVYGVTYTVDPPAATVRTAPTRSDPWICLST